MSITAAPMVAAVSAGLPTTRADSFNISNRWGRKKAKTSCFPISTTTVSIDSHQGFNHPTPLRETPSFCHNATSLCGQFPSVHHGIIASLLESAANDYIKASCLIRQVDESGLHNSSSHDHNSSSGTSTSSSLQFRAKRPRDWNLADEFMDDDEEGNRSISDGDDRRGESHLKNTHGNSSAAVHPHAQTTDPVTSCSDNGVPATHHNEMELQRIPSFQSSRLYQFHEQLPSLSSLSSPATTPPAASPTPDSYNDAVMNVPSLQASSSTTIPSRDSSSAASKSVPSSTSGQTVQGLQHTVQVLSRVIWKQSEKISSLQHEQHRLVEENRQLKSSMTITTEELRQCRDTNQILQFYLSSNRASSDFISSSNNGNGPSDGGGSGFDFFGTSRMPDVC